MNWLDGVWGWPVWKNSVVLHNLRTPKLPQGPRRRVLNDAVAAERVNRGLETKKSFHKIQKFKKNCKISKKYFYISIIFPNFFQNLEK